MSWFPSYSKLGPPKHLKPRPYHPTLELLETQSNKQCLKDYEQDIHNYLSLIESNSSINCSMIDLQPEIQWYMRPYLLDFLIEIHQSFKLHPQTLFLAVSIIDKYCSKRVVFKRHYQLVGCTSLWLAAKYEDKKSRVPTLKELTIMCRNAYDQEMFIQMEKHILSTLEWSLTHTSLEDCLQISLINSHLFFNESLIKFNQKLNILLKIENLTRFFCELSLYERNYLKFQPSLIAITSHLLSCRILGSETAIDSIEYAIKKHYSQNIEIDDDETFDENLENEIPNVIIPFLSGFNENSIDQIIIIAILLINSFKNCSQALKNKYKSIDSFSIIQSIDSFINKYSNLINILPDPTSFENIQDLKQIQEFNYTGSYLLGFSFPSSQNIHQQQEEDIFIQPPSFQSHLNTPQSASSTMTSIFSTDLQNYSTSSLLTPTTTSPMDSKFQFKDPDMGTFVNQRYEGDTNSPLAQRSMNKMNMMAL